MKKRIVSIMLCLVFFVGTAFPAFARTDETSFMKIYHVDCGRKYFSPEEICGIIDIMSDFGYTHLQLAFGNNGLRFLPDNMSVSVNGRYFSGEKLRRYIAEGNEAYTDLSNGELSEEDMDAIIRYAGDRGIEIIPLLNSPGHMNALLYSLEKLSGEELGYMGSRSTIDIGNETAIALSLAVLELYADYFAARGCRYFNIGTDEYANDVFRDGAMGFGKLIEKGEYALFADYVNSASALVKAAGMTPVAFNDGFYFANTKENGGRELCFDKDILICYWQSGWGEYITCSAEALAAEGHSIINTNNAWYYVLGRPEGMFGLENALKGSGEVNCGRVAGDRAGTVEPTGAMLCLWCDDPGAEYGAGEKENVRAVLHSFALSNPVEFSLPKAELEKLRHAAFLTAYEDGTIRPNRSITRAETAEMLYCLLSDESRKIYECRDNSFVDVKPEATYNTAVSTLAVAGMLAGYEDGTFRPDSPLTRAEFAALISRFFAKTEGLRPQFYDVSNTHWAAEDIAYAQSMGWIGGYEDGSFRPNRSISRAEAAAVMNRVLGRAVKSEGMLADMSSWPDAKPGAWYYADIQEAGNSHEYVRSGEKLENRDHCYEIWQKILK